MKEWTSAGEKQASRRSRRCSPKASSICGPESSEDLRHVIVVADQRLGEVDDRLVAGVSRHHFAIHPRRQHRGTIDRDGEEVVGGAHPHAVALMDVDAPAIVELEFGRIEAEQDDQRLDAALRRGAQGIGVPAQHLVGGLDPEHLAGVSDQRIDLVVHAGVAPERPDILIVRWRGDGGKTLGEIAAERSRLPRDGVEQLLRIGGDIACRVLADRKHGAPLGQGLERMVGVGPRHARALGDLIGGRRRLAQQLNVDACFVVCEADALKIARRLDAVRPGKP